MRKSTVLATLLAAGAGATGTGALSNLASMKGSDTLRPLTLRALAQLPAIGITYVGTGGGNGEKAVVAGTQTIVPDTRPWANTNNVCSFTGGSAGLQTGQGLVVGLDGLLLLGSLSQAGQAACNPAPASATDCSKKTGGTAYDTTITTPLGTYTFKSWREVLAIVYAGALPPTYTAEAASPLNAPPSRAYPNGFNCASVLRNTLVNNWGNLYENGAPASGTGTGACTPNSASPAVNLESNRAQLQHAFRRDDAAATADMFATLLGLGISPSSTSNFNTGASPFCNVVQPQTFAIPLNNASVNITITDSASPPNVYVASNFPQAAAPAFTLPATITVNLPSAHSLTGVNQWANVFLAANNGSTTTLTNTSKSLQGGFQVTSLGPKSFSYVVPAGSNIVIPANNPIVEVETYAVRPNAIPERIATDYVDDDPIRRNCAGANLTASTGVAEDVCNADRKLGLVLPIVPTDFAPGGVGQQYPGAPNVNGGTTIFNNGGIAIGPAPTFFNPLTGLKFTSQFCPNGGTPTAGTCSYDTASGVAALEKRNGGITTFYAHGNVNGIDPAGGTANPGTILADPRVFNLYLPVNTVAANGGITLAITSTSAGNNAKITQNDLLNRDISGAYYRIHSAHTLIAGNVNPANTCTQVSADLSLGCLVQASPYSVGFTGRGADQWNAPNPSNNVALRINETAPLKTCIQLLGQNQATGVVLTSGPTPQFPYPLARKLYLNTLIGFNATTGVNGDELSLARYENSAAFLDNGGLVEQFGFVALPPATTATGGTPLVSASTGVAINAFPAIADLPAGAGGQFAEDLNEQLLCSKASNVNGATSNSAPFPVETVTDTTGATALTVSTICGNGRVEQFEECDDGAPGTPQAVHGGNGASTSNCSTICRTIQ